MYQRSDAHPEAAGSSPAPNRPDHTVHFYEDAASLGDVASEFLAAGLSAGQTVVAIATPAHAQAFVERLASKGIDVEAARSRGQLLIHDAEATLASFMVDGMPDEALFDAMFGTLLERHVQSGTIGLRAFGEMVELLWKSGQRDAAIRLEELWNRLAARYPFALLCAYSIGNFCNEHAGMESVEDVCRTHTYVLPVAPAAGPENDEQRRLAYALLERRARALEAEIEHRRQLEAALRVALSERGRAEVALRETEQELRDFLENAADGMHWVGPDGTILWVNQAELDMLGYSRDEYVGRHIADFHVDRAGVDDILARLWRNETLRNHEAKMRCKDGSVRDVLISSSVFWRNGEFVHTRCITRDVTEQRLGERQRRLATRHLEAEHAVTGILADGRPFDDVVPRLLETVGEVGDWQAGALWMVDEGTRTLRCAEFWHEPGLDVGDFETFTKGHQFARGAGLPGRVWSEGEPAWIEDVVEDSNFPRAPLAAKAGLHGALAFPIRVRGRVAGVLEFFSRDVRSPDRDLLDLFDAVGTQIGQFIERRETEIVRERLAAIVDSSDDAIVSKTLDGVIMSWNRGAEHIFGYTAAEAVGRHISLIIPDDRLPEEAEVLARLRRGERIDHYETERQAKDGRRLNISLTISPIKDADGRVVGASKVARDITERKRAAAALAESERRFRILADSAPVPIWVNGVDGGCEFVNGAYLDFFGLPLERIQGLGWLSRVHPDDLDGSLAAYRDAVALRAPFQSEMRMLRADGEYRWVEAYALPRFSVSGEILGYVGVSPDITEHKNAEEALRQREVEAQAQVHARDEFLSVAAHELRNPLNALQLQLVGLYRTIQERADALPKRWIVERVRQANEDVGTLVRLVHNLLDVARIRAGRMDVEPEEIEFGHVVRGVLNRFSLQLADRQLVLDLEPVSGRSDRLRVEQVVSNLVSNAIKYGEGKPIEVSLDADDGKVYLTVRDYGIGIAPEDQARLFERFSRAVPRGKYGGFGLGLWIARETVRAMGGEISLASQPGAGTTFSVTLPRVLTAEQMQAAADTDAVAWSAASGMEPR